MSESVADRTRRRIRAEMDRRGIKQIDLVGLLGWKEAQQSKLSKILNGHTDLTVDDLADICFAIDLSLVEAIRDHGLEFLAEMTPTEMRFLERLRQLSVQERDALSTILYVKERTELQERRAYEKKMNKDGLRMR